MSRGHIITSPVTHELARRLYPRSRSTTLTRPRFIHPSSCIYSVRSLQVKYLWFIHGHELDNMTDSVRMVSIRASVLVQSIKKTLQIIYAGMQGVKMVHGFCIKRAGIA